MIKNKKQAEDFVYRSYMKAARLLKYDAADCEKRHPEYTRAIMHQLDEAYNRENILVTGSKGKGSVSVMISAILQAHGENVGLLTSPHIIDFNERIRINDTYITDEELISCCNKLRPTIELIDSTIAENMYVSPIGIQALIALLHFGRRTDHSIFECGKGVMYDDVNNLSRSYSVINRIFPEHTRELGKSLKEIASDKAKIIDTGGKFAYTAVQDAEVMQVLEKRAADCGVELKKYGEDFFCRNIRLTAEGTEFDIITKNTGYNGLALSLLGAHQAENAVLAAAVCEDILGEIDIEALKSAFKAVRWPGRLEIISRSPLTIADACINRVSAERVKEVIAQLPHERPAAVIGIPVDKDYRGAAEVMAGISDRIIFTAADSPHYKFDKAQAACVPNAVFIRNSGAAIRAAKKTGADIICILGTTALIAEIYKRGG